MPVRLKDIAEQLGLSVVTVSKAMQDYPDVSPATRRRVLRKSRELGYQPNWVARSLVTRRSRTIGMVLPHLRHSFFQEVYEALVERLAPDGYTVLMGVTLDDPAAEEREIRHLLARQVDALLLASARPPHDPGPIAELAAGSTPLILLDRSFPGLQADFIGVDDRAVARLAVEHLIAQGRRRIAHVRGPNLSTAVLRLEGYREALADRSLPIHEHWIVEAPRGDSDAAAKIEDLLSADPRPDAVFCYNDPAAAAVMRAAFQLGLAVPEDLAIVGAGAMRYSDLFLRPLTTVDQKSREVGEKTAERILSLLSAERKPRPTVWTAEPTLIVRQSSGGLSEAAAALS